MRNSFKRIEKFILPGLRLVGRIVVKLASYDTTRLRMHAHGPRIHGPSERLSIGRAVDLQNAYLNTVCGTIYFGDYAFCGQNCMFLTGTHDYTQRDAARHKHPDSGNDIVIGKGVWICSGAIVLGGVKVADHAVIAAGAVVKTDCPEAGIYAGVPARLLRKITFCE
jgi:acetyltransferase-like isoleucine patch superfamily enzyme